jgi:hypothetical protein
MYFIIKAIPSVLISDFLTPISTPTSFLDTLLSLPFSENPSRRPVVRAVVVHKWMISKLHIESPIASRLSGEPKVETDFNVFAMELVSHDD